MEYQDIVNSYKNGSLDISNFKKQLDISKSLKGRQKLRALTNLDNNTKNNYIINDLLLTPETPEKTDEFYDTLNNLLFKEYEYISNLMTINKSWNFLGLDEQEYNIEKFNNLNAQEKIILICDLKKQYLEFLKYQKIADFRDCAESCFKSTSENIVSKEYFLWSIFSQIDNEQMRREFFCFSENFLKQLDKFRSKKNIKLDDFMKSSGKNIQDEYEKLLQYFTKEDLKEISEIISLTKSTLKIPVDQIIQIFSQISETEFENYHLKRSIENLEKLKEKVKSMDNILKLKNESKSDKNKSEKRVEKSVILENTEENANNDSLDNLKKEDNTILKNDEGSTGKMDDEIQKLRKTYTVKEKVKVLFLVWADEEDKTFKKIARNKKEELFFKRIKEIEKETGTRVSLFLITTSGKEITKKRFEELRTESNKYGLPRLVEGAFGAYSSFWIDSDGNIQDLAIMSKENREKIINLLDRYHFSSFPRELIEKDQLDFIRYKISDKKDKNIDYKYLTYLIISRVRNPRIAEQPLRFSAFIEENCSGIDVLLKSQTAGISTQLEEYYKAKYDIEKGKNYKVNIYKLDDFIDSNKVVNDNQQDEKI